MIPPALGTRINGKLYDYSSVVVTIRNIVYSNVTDINYSHSLDPGVLRGTSPMWRGRTRGTYDTNGSFSMYKEDYQNLIGQLAAAGMGGYMEATFQITVIYRDFGAVLPITDTLNGCRIKGDDDSHSSGNDPIIVKADLSIFELIRGGLHAVDTLGRSANLKP